MPASERSRKRARASSAPLISAWPRLDEEERAVAPATHDRSLALAVVVTYVAASLAYGLLADAPWDDDCVGRYFNTLRATSEPRFFFDLWSRPLFVILFAFTAKLGPTAMMVQMVAINAAAGWSLFSALRRMGARLPWLALVFYFFQTYFFSTSRNNLTEPLAAALICFALHALVTRRFAVFALIGSLLPLARMELSLALPIWALVLMMEGRTRHVPLLLTGVVFLMIGGWLVHEGAGLFWLVSDTIGTEGTNRYGHQEFLHYFKRFAYVTGPAVFYFAFIGSGVRLLRRRLDLFILLQGLAILMIYVVFSWKLNMGNAAGFLRNLMPLTPMIAVLALFGLHHWLSALGAMAPAPVAAEAPVNTHGKKHAPSADSEQQVLPRRSLMVHALSLAATLVILIAYSRVLFGHHKIDGASSYVNVAIAGTLAALLLLGAWLLRRYPAVRRPAMTISLIAVITATCAHTLITEPPDAHMNDERATVGHLAEVYKGSYLQGEPLYTNHDWFYWHLGALPPDEGRFGLSRKNVDAAPPHALFLWDSHYSSRLGADVQRAWIQNHKDLVDLYRMVSTDRAFELVLYQKVDPRAQDGAKLSQQFLATFPKEMGAWYGRCMDRTLAGDHQGALEDAAAMLGLDSTHADAQMMHGMGRFNLRDHQGALAEFTALREGHPEVRQSNYYIGTIHNRLMEPARALAPLEEAAKDMNDLPEVFEQLGLSYFSMQDFEKAHEAFSTYIRLRPRHQQGYSNRALCSQRLGRLQEGVLDMERAIQLEPGNAHLHLLKALIHVQGSETDRACESLHRAADLGSTQARAMINTTCRPPGQAPVLPAFESRR